MKELPRKRGLASFKGTVAEFRRELQDFREFMESYKILYYYGRPLPMKKGVDES